MQLSERKVFALVLTVLLLIFAVTHLQKKSGLSLQSLRPHVGDVKPDQLTPTTSQHQSIKKKSGLPPSGVVTQNEWRLHAQPKPQEVEDTLPQEVMDGIEKFAFFIGYARSGHSIVGSFIDAHPNMVIAYEYRVFDKISKLGTGDRETLFNRLYSTSYRNAISGWTSGKDTAKNYSLQVDYPWQGRYDKRISVIGDKSGGRTAMIYEASPQNFVERYTQLKKMVKIPLKSVFVVRNPFDLISTRVLYHCYEELKEILKRTLPEDKTKDLKSTAQIVALYKSTMKQLQKGNSNKDFPEAKYDNKERLEEKLNSIAKYSEANDKLIDLLGEENILFIHNENLVDDPKSELVRICQFFEVECTSDYVQACADKVFKSVSRTRDFIVWPTRLRKMVEEDIIGRYKFFAKYTFESD